MATLIEEGFLLIADLSGYTEYLSRSELEHAPAIAGDLLETVVGRLDPPFRLGKFEGDAAFLYVEAERADGSLLFDAIEAAYLAFRRRLRSIDQASACDCNSCRLAPRLDLKFIIHHGSYVLSRIVGRDELAGSDVILVHRLLKGVASTATRGGFVLATESAVGALGIEPTALGATVGEESVEHLGNVRTYAIDLEARWQAEAGFRRLTEGEGEPILDVTLTAQAGPAEVWGYLTAPALRALWEGPMEIVEESPTGMRGVGTTSQCVTGRLATLEEIVDYQPYDHIGWRIAVPDVGPVAAVADLEAEEGGSRLRVRWESLSSEPVDPSIIERIRVEREAALQRLVTIVVGTLPVIEQSEANA
jgi:uncharacterized protein YndB with AHSA1/START domain